MTPLPLPAATVVRLGWVLVHSVWQLAFLAVAALLLQRDLQRSSSAARYWVLLLALGAMGAAPAATWLAIPRESGSAEVSATTESDRCATLEGPAATPLEGPPPDEQTPTPASYSFTAWSWVARGLRPWLNALVLAWCAGVLAFSTRPVLGWCRVRRLRTAGVSAVSDAIRRALDHTAGRLRMHRTVAVLQSTLVETAAVVGYFRPVILLPASVVTGLPAAQLEAILAHELAHVRRHDYLVNLLQMLAETVFFYHPAVWWISHQIRCERENCCDDVAVAALGNPVEYGRALLALEEQRRAETALIVGARGGSLLGRVRRLLGHAPPGRPFSGGSAVGLGLLAAATLTLGVWVTGRFDESPVSGAASRPARAGETEDRAKADGWVPIFNGKDLTGWFVEGEHPEAWRAERGELLVDAAKGGRRYNWLLTEKTYSEFVLRFEYQLSQGASSGVAFWATRYEKVYREGPIHPEIKLLDDPSHPDIGWPTGTLFWNLDGGGHLLPPDRRARLEPAGSWNRVEVEARARSLRVRVTGLEVLSARPGELAQEQGAFAGLKRCSGHIGFEKNAGVARYRNIAVKELKHAPGGGDR